MNTTSADKPDKASAVELGAPYDPEEHGMATHEKSDLTKKDYENIAREKLGMAPADSGAIDVPDIKARYEDARKSTENDPWNFSCDETLRTIVMEDHPALIAAVEALQGQLIWGFYEEEVPEYIQGSEKLHELHELVTADECNGLVKTIKTLRMQKVELAEHLDKTIAVAADAVNRMNAAEAHAVELAGALDEANNNLRPSMDEETNAAHELATNVLATMPAEALERARATRGHLENILKIIMRMESSGEIRRSHNEITRLIGQILTVLPAKLQEPAGL